MRRGDSERETNETRIRVSLDLDGPPEVCARTDIPFFDHMLTAMGFHGGMNLQVDGEGDLQVDGHHLVEDVGLCIGRALKNALEDDGAIERFGHAVIPMDESLVAATVDLSGRPFFAGDLPVPARAFGAFHTDLVPEFFRAFSVGGGITLHLRVLAGGNAHHLCEAAFKATGRALHWAVQAIPDGDVPSTKGVIDR